MPEDDVKKKLLSSRKDLLDIGLRNNLINFRPSSKSLRIVDEISAEVANTLCRQNRSMTFLHMAPGKQKSFSTSEHDEQTADLDDASNLELLQELEGLDWDTDGNTNESGGIAKRHTDTRLQTALSEKKLFLNLLKIHTEAETYIQEQGVNILFLALGFLHWYEAGASDKVRKAPLILVPVSLQRVGARDAFKLEYADDDLVQNLSLSAKLKTDFSIDLPQFEFAYDSDEMPSLDRFYRHVEDVVGKQARWKVAKAEIHLGFFSFGKFLMFNDLNPEIWPEGKKPSDHPVLSTLLSEGFSDYEPIVSEYEHLDTVISPGEVKFVRDADSSQVLAILEARSGRNLVIQGPPGTGKSQTITNIIAELLGQRKTVLFVSEKMAALEVVKRRLDECHLGDAVLELHSHKATKISVLSELRRTLEQGKPVIEDGTEDIKALRNVRDELNAYCEAVNQPVGNSQVPFINALGQYLKLKREHPGLPVWAFEPMKHWSQKNQSRSRDKINEFSLHLNEMGRPSENPFWGCTKTSFSPIEQAKLTEQLQRSISLNAQIASSADRLANLLGLSRPVSLAEVDVICRAAQRAMEAPKLQGVQLTTDEWQSRRDTLRNLLRAGQTISGIKTDYREVLIDQVWTKDLLEVRKLYANLGDKWWRIFSRQYRQSRATLQGYCKDTLPTTTHECLQIIDAVLEVQKEKEIFDSHARLGAALFGAQWRDEKSDWEVLSHLSNWIFDLYDDLGKGQLPNGILVFLSGHPDSSGLGDDIVPIRIAVSSLRSALGGVKESLKLGQTTSTGSLHTQTLQELGKNLVSWKEGLNRLYLLVRFNQLFEEMVELGLEEFANHSTDWGRPGSDFVAAFDLCWFAGLVDLGYAASPNLSKFDSIKQAHLINRFRALDKTSLAHAQAALAKQIWDNQPSINQPGEMAVIRTELNKKRKHKPIRKLIDEAGRAIQQLKPVLMMSPMSIANFLPPGKVEFDVVIFDEASQVKAVDAFGAILRGKQTIVVGDIRQMPPTDFFGRDVELDEEDNVTADIESILSMFRARGAPERYLSWHYRSRHESLIAVSNVEFYERRLVIFPSSGTNKFATGLKFRHLPGAIYDRGRTRTNKAEAKAVAQAILHHAKTNPHLSLGVVAFSVAQRDLIQVELEIMRRTNTDLDPYFVSSHPTEPFFVKNLENVQGDERDVIFISIGYGRNESGRIAKEFGPLNRDGGERRLNVLISRAKMAMEVFCNFTAGDLELDANTNHGVRALKHFLQYAESGQLDIPIETGRQADSPFELEVKQAIEEKGYSLEPQVGAAGYFIDLAVKDPDQPGRYVLAIECDGASYHSARSARDRDRLRQGVLENLGWRFHRIWSTDWFRNPLSALQKAVDAIEDARNNIDPARPIEVTSDQSHSDFARDSASGSALGRITNYYQKAEIASWTGAQALHEVPAIILSHLIENIVKAEGPLHEINITKRLLAAFSLSRAGNRIVDNVTAAIRHGHKIGLYHYKDGFVYADSSMTTAVRNRSLLESSERKIELVPPNEIDSSLIEIVEISFSISRGDIISESLEMLGFGRATSNIASILNDRINILIAAGMLTEEGGKIILK